MSAGLLLSVLLGGVLGALGGLIAWAASRKLEPSRAAQRFKILTAISVVPGVIVGQTLAQTNLGTRLDVLLGKKSRVDLVITRSGNAIKDHPKFRAAVAGKSKAEVEAYARSLGLMGIPLLSEPDLDRWEKLQLRLAQNSPALCARLWKGNVSLDLLKSALGGLNDTELDHYSALLVKAGTLALERGSPSAPAPGNTEKAFAQITSQLPAAEQSTFLADIGRSDLTDERACALFKTMFEGSQKLEPSLRTDLYRGLVQQR